MNLKRVIFIAASIMCVASMAFAQASLTGGILKMPVDNASTPLGNPLTIVDVANNAVNINAVQISASPYSTWTDVSTMPGGSALNTLTSYVSAAYNNGWDKSGLTGGITSYGVSGDDTAFNNLDGNSDTAIGLISVDDYENTLGYGTTFFSTDITAAPATGVVMRYTYLGDSDFDGAITKSDIRTVVGNYNSHAAGTWINGSTDYGAEGTIQKSDIRQVVGEYNSHVPAMNPPAGAGGIVPVPEPSTIALLLIGVSLLVLRRRLSK